MIKKIFLFLILCFSNIYSAIFIAGSNSLEKPCLWITDNFGFKLKTLLLDNTTGNGNAVINYSNKIFIAGNSDSKPCLWVTNSFGTTAKQIFLSLDSGNCINLVAYQNNLYLIGNKNGQATLWIYNIVNGSFTAQPLDPGVNASDLLVANDLLYIIGFKDLSTPPTEVQPTLWITDLTGNALDTVYLYGIGSVATGISQYGNACYILSLKNGDPGQDLYLTKVDLKGAILNKILFQTTTFDTGTYNIIINGATSYMLTGNGLYTTPLSQITSTPYTLAVPNPASESWVYFNKNNDNYYIAGQDSLFRACLYIYDNKGNLLKQVALDEEGSVAWNLTTLSLGSSLLNFSPIKFQRGF